MEVVLTSKKYLWLYRSFLFKKIVFKTTNKELEEIKNALNIKKRKERLAYIYDTACNQIDEHFKGLNFCGFSNSKCYAQKCSNKINGCCRKCRYQTNHGCPTKNLACKLFFCSEVKERTKIITFEEIDVLRLLHFRQKMIIKSDYFSTIEDVLKDIYWNSLCIACIRMVPRIMKNFVLYNKNKKGEEHANNIK